MPGSISSATLEKFFTFGDLLRFLRRRVGLTQLEFAMQVGYSDSQISRLEQNMRLPDPSTIEARFITVLGLQDEPAASARLLELATTVRREDAPYSGMCPYKGLNYFDEVDADLFMGREALSEKLVTRVLELVSIQSPDGFRVLAVVGASGSGKSSLVRAGLVPALRWHRVSASWSMHIFTPTMHPLESLASALQTENSSLASTLSLKDDLAADSRSLSFFINRQVRNDESRYFLLIVDQFEELFTLCHSDDERSTFINNLIMACTAKEGRCIVVITLRSDFYTHCAAYPHLRQALAANQEFIGAMSSEEMRRAIEEPSRRTRWDFEPGLVDLILQDVGQEPGALPLLSHALLETWQRRHGRTLTLNGYISAGGVRGAIAETAEAVFTDQLNPAQKAIARRIFLRLTELGDESSACDTRRRVSYNELVLEPEDAEDTQYVLKILSDARLLTMGEDSVQVAHEALIREWPTLRSWLEDDRFALRLHRQLTEAAQDWQVCGNESGLLFRGARLAQAREWSDNHHGDLNSLEKDFLAASIELSEREITEHEAQQQRELLAAQKLADTERQRAEDESKSARRLRYFSILLAGVSLLVVILAIFAIVSWQRSTIQATTNLSASLANYAEQANQIGQGDMALALAMEAVNVSPSSLQSLKVLRSVALGPGTRSVISTDTRAIRALEISPDAKTALVGTCASLDSQNICSSGELVLLDFPSGRELHRWTGHSSWVIEVAFSSDGKEIISGSDDGTLLEWDANGKFIRQLMGHRGKIIELLSVPGTNNLLTGSVDGYMLLFDLSTGNVLQRFQYNRIPLTALGITPDGLKAISAYQDGSIKVWKLTDREPSYFFQGESADIAAINVSLDKHWILYTEKAVSDYSLKKLNILDGSLMGQLNLDCMPGQMVLSPDGANLFITCAATLMQIDIPTLRISRRFVGNGETYNSISISLDGAYGITSADDGTLRVWNLKDQLESRFDPLDADNLSSLAITSDGRYLLLNDYQQNSLETPAVYDLTQKKVIKIFFGKVMSFVHGGLAVSPDGKYLAAIGIEVDSNISQALLWDMDDRGLNCVITDFEGHAKDVVFSPDSRDLLIGTGFSNVGGGQLARFDIQTCQKVSLIESSADIASLAYNTAGTRVLTGSEYSGGVTLWDITSGQELLHYSLPDRSPVWSVAFGPGEHKVLGSGLGEILAWDIDTALPMQSYLGLSAYPLSMAVSPDGNYVLSGTRNGELVLWDFTSGEVLHRINTNYAITSVVFSSDSKTAYAAAQEGKLIELAINNKSLPELLEWIKSNRYVRELTCAERQQYHLDPECKS